MRLLAYGGTSYIERCRIGQWPNILEGALSDTYLLGGNELRFGVGLLQEDSPFLILRQRQHIENRGGYAFTLLLDPGVEVWEKFQWNGAALAQSILADKIADTLLSAPEEITEQQLSTVIESLIYKPKLGDPKQTPFHSLWVGAILEQDAAVVVNPKYAGLDRWPQLDETGDLLSGLLPCFRCGFGWLMGGSKEQGEAFGAHLVFDINAPDDPQIEAMIAEGERTICGWEKVSSLPPAIKESSAFNEQLARRSAKAIHLWETPETDSVTDYLTGITDLADRFDNPSRLKTPSRYKGSELKEPLAVATLISALSGEDDLNDDRTSIVLSHVFEREFIPEQKDVTRLNAEVIADELSKRGLAPTSPDVPMTLAAAVRIKVWRKLIETEEDTQRLPDLLRNAVKDLIGPVQAREVDQKEICELGELAINQTFMNKGQLRIWASSLQDNSIGPLIGESLRNISIKAIQSEVNTEVVLDYLALGHDDGATALLEFNLTAADAGKIVNVMFAERYSGKLKNEAHKWLLALADSRFRLAVLLDSKLNLTSEFKKWGNLLILWQLYSGHTDVPKPAMEIGDFEREALHKEFGDMLNDQKTASGTPNLQGIVELLGELSSTEIETLLLKKKPRDLKSATRWLQGWKSLKQEDIYQSELLRLLLLEEKLSKNFSLSRLSDAGLNTLIEKTLTGDPNEDETLLPRLKSFLLKKDDETRFSSALTAHLERVALNPGRPLVLIQFLQNHTPSRDLLFESIDARAQDQLIVHLAAEDDNGFTERAYKIYREVLVSSNPMTCFEEAVLRFLRSPKGKKIKNQIETRHLSIHDAQDMDKNLRIMLVNSESFHASDEKVVVEEPPRGFWSTLFNKIKRWYHSFDER